MENHWRLTVRTRRPSAGVFAMALALALAIPSWSDVQAVSDQRLPLLASDLFRLVNAERQRRDLPSLRWNRELTIAAERKAEDMLAEQFFGHDSPAGRHFTVWVKEQGYRYAIVGENLARDFDDTESVVDAWMTSQSHRENLLQTEYREVGYAVRTGQYQGRPAVFIAAEFGAPGKGSGQIADQQVYRRLIEGQLSEALVPYSQLPFDLDGKLATAARG